MTTPAQKPGKSKQDYNTPSDFIETVKARLNIDFFDLDIAADSSNTQAIHWWSKEDDAFTHSWNFGYNWSWLNPPFANIGPYAQKAYSDGGKIAMLVPASVGANWWRDWVDGKSYVLFLNGRLKFGGCKDYYPKDCALVLYTPERFIGNEVWSWSQRRILS